MPCNASKYDFSTCRLRLSTNQVKISSPYNKVTPGDKGQHCERQQLTIDPCCLCALFQHGSRNCLIALKSFFFLYYCFFFVKATALENHARTLKIFSVNELWDTRRQAAPLMYQTG